VQRSTIPTMSDFSMCGHSPVGFAVGRVEHGATRRPRIETSREGTGNRVQYAPANPPEGYKSSAASSSAAPSPTPERRSLWVMNCLANAAAGAAAGSPMTDADAGLMSIGEDAPAARDGRARQPSRPGWDAASTVSSAKLGGVWCRRIALGSICALLRIG
jgi:hypothetical protein